MSENQDQRLPISAGEVEIAPPPETVDPLTAMVPRFGLPARAFGDRFFTGFGLEPSDSERIRQIQ